MLIEPLRYLSDQVMSRGYGLREPEKDLGEARISTSLIDTRCFASFRLNGRCTVSLIARLSSHMHGLAVTSSHVVLKCRRRGMQYTTRRDHSHAPHVSDGTRIRDYYKTSCFSSSFITNNLFDGHEKGGEEYK